MDLPPERTSSESFCLFRSGNRSLGVALSFVVEVMGPARVVPLPLCPRWVLGLCATRGGFVPVVAPIQATELPKRSVDRDRHAVMLLRTTRGSWGIAIERVGILVTKELTFRATEISSSPDAFVVMGVSERDGAPLELLDPERSWERLRAEIEGWYRAVPGAEESEPPAERRPMEARLASLSGA